MNIDSTSVAQSLYSHGVTAKSTTLQATEDTTTTSSSSIYSDYIDTVTISDTARAMQGGSKMPPPPEEMDFDSMSDEDLLSYVQPMQEATGQVPGMADDTALDELSSEQISSLRETLADMAANPPAQGQGGPEGMQGAQGGTPPPKPPEESNVDELSDEELLEYLEKMQELTGGAIPGMGEDASVDSLSSDDLTTIRSALKAISTGAQS